MSDKSDKRNEFVTMARLAEQTERYEDMVDHMKKVIDIAKELNNEERNLLSIAYKNAVGQRRTAWRAVTAYEIKEKSKILKYQEVIIYYKKRIEKELSDYCNDILGLLDSILLKKTSNPEARVFYHKMKGDYNRYLSEFTLSKQQERAVANAQASYQDAINLMDKDNSSNLSKKTNLLRLGVSLNYSVFLYEIKSDVQAACQLAKQVFEEASKELDEIDEEHYKDATTIMQLLRDNLTNWSGEIYEEENQNNQKSQSRKY